MKIVAENWWNTTFSRKLSAFFCFLNQVSAFGSGRLEPDRAQPDFRAAGVGLEITGLGLEVIPYQTSSFIGSHKKSKKNYQEKLG